MLGLGMAPTAAVFSVVHAVLLRPSPFPKPTRCGGWPWGTRWNA